MAHDGRLTKLMLIIGCATCIAITLGIMVAIAVYDMNHRSEGLVLLMMAAIADGFIMAGYAFANMYARKFFGIPDIIAMFTRVHPRYMMYTTTAVLFSPVLVALTRIAFFR